MTTKTKAEELAAALTRADAVATQLTTRKDAAAELRRLAGVEAERDYYLTETRTLVRQNGEWQEKCDRLAAEVEALRAEVADWKRRHQIEQQAAQSFITGGRYPDGTKAW